MIFQEMRSLQIAEIDRERTVVVMPVAATEQHGPHMPTGTDSILCTAIAEAVEEKLQSEVLLLPTVCSGASSHHLRFGATLDIRLRTFVELIRDVCTSVLDDGFRRILILNGHGGNVDPIRIGLRELQPQYVNALLVGGSYWSVANQMIDETLEGEHQFVGHACEFETSLMLHLRPELVDTKAIQPAGELVADKLDGMFVCRDMKQRTKSGFTGRPDLATAAKGQILFDGIVSNLLAFIRELQSQPLGSIYTDFV